MDKDPGTDRRVIRTKAAIREAFIQLLDEKGFESLTVKDITIRANVNRGTFYLHYLDKFDLLEKIEMETVQDIEEIIMQANSFNIADFNTINNPLPIVVTLFEYLKANASLMHAILRLEGRFDFQNQIKQAIEKNLKVGFLDVLKASKFLVPSEYLISYTLSAHFGVIQVWLQKGCVESPYEMALILSKLSINGPFHATGISFKKS